MSELSLDAARIRLREIAAALQPGEEVVLTDNGQSLARTVKTVRTRGPCKAGSAQGKILVIGPNFDAPLGGVQGVRGVRLLLDAHALL